MKRNKSKFVPIKGVHYFKDEDKKYAISNALVESGFLKGIRIDPHHPERKE